ncbi:MAG: CvpA family protein [Alphaproteobacteria bacterium]
MIIEDLTKFDYIIIFIVFASVILAFVKGFVKSIISLIGWLFILGFTYYLNPYLTPIIKKYTSNIIIINLSTIFSTFIISLIVSSVVVGKLGDLTKNIRGGIIDRSLGLVFGFARGALFSCIIVTFISLLWQIFVHKEDNDNNIAAPDWLKKAQTYNLLNEGNKLIASILPQKILSEINKIHTPSEIISSFGREQMKDKIAGSLVKEIIPKSVLDDIKKLNDPNVSQVEKMRILNSIQKMNKSISPDSNTATMLQEFIKNAEKNGGENPEDSKGSHSMKIDIDRLIKNSN